VPQAKSKMQMFHEKRAHWKEGAIMKTAFISGHRDLTPQEFKEHYIPLIEQAISEGCAFVIGDAPGADAMAQAYIFRRQPGPVADVTIYYAGGYPRNDFPLFHRRGGYANHTAKDEAMTLASDFDIAWVRPGRGWSGTARNLKRRANKQALEHFQSIAARAMHGDGE
jgi:hypothetical protein